MIPSAPLVRAVRSRDQLLQRFLQAYWLRPENAFWMVLRSEALARQPLVHPMADLSCGDGVFSFLHAGGVFDPAFDVFQSVGGLDHAGDHRADMFDHVDPGAAPAIVKAAPDTIDVGTDLKPNLLGKARQLNLYSRLLEHDHNAPLPFDDDAFETVYCNAAYWVRNIDGFLAEVGRITRAGGSIILQVKLSSMRDHTLRAHREQLGDRFLALIDRGRLDTWVTLADRATWESRFAAAGLVVRETTPFVTGTHARIWDIGLRPLAPLLVKMTRSLNPETRAAIKQEWVELFRDLLAPLCDPVFDLLPGDGEPAEMQYILTPR